MRIRIKIGGWGLPVCPVVGTSPSNAGGVGLISGQGAKILHALQPKNQNIKQNNTVKISTKIFKIVHIFLKIFFF